MYRETVLSGDRMMQSVQYATDFKDAPKQEKQS